MKLRIFILVLVLISLTSFSACSLDATGSSNATNDNIFINGMVEETIEANTDFIDPGVSYPSDLTLITKGKIDTSRLGRQEIIYQVYSSDGELVKEMHRFVTVVDTTAPTFVVAPNQTYYVGFHYTISDFVSEYSDNYNDQSSITLSSDNFIFTSPGQHKIDITFTDTSNNSTVYTNTINAVLDVEKLIYEVYKNQSYKITSTDTSIGSHYTGVDIDSERSFSYFSSGSLHYLETVTTALGKRASIQISAEYGDFDHASISFHISGYGSAYSVGDATIDATQQYVTVNSFNWTINDLNLDINAMLIELNQSLNSVLNNFQEYMSGTLHLELK